MIVLMSLYSLRIGVFSLYIQSLHKQLEAASGMVNTIAAFIVFPAASGVTLDMSPIYHTFNESYHYWSHEIALEIKH